MGPEAVADPALAPSNLSASQQLYGFEEGPVQMRPDLLMDALLLMKEAPGLVMSGVRALRGSGAKAAMGQLDEASSAFLKKFDDYDEAFGWKWECYATIEGNKVIHSESKDVWSEFKIVKIELPKIEE